MVELILTAITILILWFLYNKLFLDDVEISIEINGKEIIKYSKKNVDKK